MPAASVPAAPPRFSTITGCPSESPICWMSDLAITSVGPPAGAPTNRRIGFVG